MWEPCGGVLYLVVDPDGVLQEPVLLLLHPVRLKWLLTDFTGLKTKCPPSVRRRVPALICPSWPPYFTNIDVLPACSGYRGDRLMLTSPTWSLVAFTLWNSFSLAAAWFFWTSSSFSFSKNWLLARSSRSAISSNSIQS